MTNLNIDLDIGRLQSSVQAAIRPAVESALSEIDLQKIIRDQLLHKQVQNTSHSHLYRLAMLGYGDVPHQSLIESLVHESIQELAKHYVTTQLAEMRGDIEESFRKMMAGSSSRLVKAFAKATEDALKQDWGFELSVKVDHTVAENERDDHDY